MNPDPFVVIIPTSSSEGLKSMDRTVARHEIAVCIEKRIVTISIREKKGERGNKINIAPEK